MPVAGPNSCGDLTLVLRKQSRQRRSWLSRSKDGEFKPLAERGNATAQFNHGVMYAKGHPRGAAPTGIPPRCRDVGGYEAYMKRTGTACQLD